jgi:hypothetical protein
MFELNRATPEVNLTANPHPNESVLEGLAATIRDAHEAVLAATANALAAALDAGDALITAKARVTEVRVTGGWTPWVQKYCRLGESTARLYMQLARHRAKIESEVERVGELTLCGARRLITKKPPKQPTPKPHLLVAWRNSTDRERTAALEAIPLLDFLHAMPMAWRTELTARGAGLHDKQPGEPDARISKALRTALSHVVAADQPKIGKPAAQGQENSALTALRTILTVLRGIDRDLHGVEIVLKPRQTDQTRRRAA